MGKGRSGPIFTRPEEAYGASAGVEGFGVAFVLVIGILTCFRVRTHGVPARRCFWWLYATLPVLFLYVNPSLQDGDRNWLTFTFLTDLGATS